MRTQDELDQLAPLAGAFFDHQCADDGNCEPTRTLGQEAAPELFEGIVALRNGDLPRGEKLLTQMQSDNTIDGVDSLLQSYTKTAKLVIETPITP